MARPKLNQRKQRVNLTLDPYLAKRAKGLAEEYNMSLSLLVERALEEQLIAERDQLKKWKEEAISVMPPMQEIGEEIGVGFGQTIHDKILPELIRRREAKDRSREIIANLASEAKEEQS
jgi:post-segregation antitoxin (ccd killing protein)